MQWHRGVLVHLSGSPDLAGAADALRCHLEDRIIAYGNKTVVFD